MSTENVEVGKWIDVNLNDLRCDGNTTRKREASVLIALQVQIPLRDEFPSAEIYDAVDELRERYSALCKSGAIDAARLYGECVNEANKALALGEAAGED